MKGWTRRSASVASAAWLLALLGACRADEADTTSSRPEWARRTIEEVRQTARWQISLLAHAPRGFRPFGWEGTEALWGLAGSRIARLPIDSAVAADPFGDGADRLAWNLTTAPGVVSWTNERGWYVLQFGATPVLRAPMTSAPAGTDGPPHVLWSPDGARALLTWTGEGVSAYALARRAGGAPEPTTIRVEGYSPAQPVVWLDDGRLLVEVRALVRRDGTAQATESGQRGELAVHDLTTGTTRVVARTADDQFLTATGLVAPDSVLVVERDRDGKIMDAWVYHTRNWERQRRALPSGRAFPHPSGRIAILDERGDSTAVFIVEGRVARRLDGVHPVPAEPLVWSPDGERIAFVDGGTELSRVVIAQRIP